MTIMQKHWKNRTALALGIHLVLAGVSMHTAYAAEGDTSSAVVDTSATSEGASVASDAPVSAPADAVPPKVSSTPKRL